MDKLDTMNAYRKLFACLMAFSLLSHTAFSNKPSTEDPVLLYADQLQVDHERGLISARGNVKVFQEDRGLTADLVTYNRQTGIVTASGNVALTEPTGDVSFANYAELTGDLKDGVVRNIKVLLSDDAKFAAAIGQQQDGTKLKLHKAVYSPCKVCKENPDSPPFWQVKARKILWNKEERDVVYHDAWLEIFGIPAFYTPYLRHPDPKVKRRSGFLAPLVGNSSSSTVGTFFMVPYYFEVADDKDLTLQPLVTTKGGAFLGAEYRQRFSSGITNLKGSLGSGRRITSSTTEMRSEKFRGHLDTMLRMNINPDWRWGFDIVRSTDKTYLRQFPYYGHTAENSLDSSVFAEGFYGRNYLHAQGLAFQGIREEDRQSQTPVIFPSLDFNYLSRPQGFGYRWSVDANTLVLTRQKGTDMRRLSVTGGWQFPYTTSRGDVFTLNALLRGDVYHIDNFIRDEQTQKEEREWRGRGFPQASLEWRYPFVQRGENHHVIVEPILSVVGAPKLGGQEKFPNEDSIILEPNDYNMLDPNRYPGLDRIDDGSRFNYGLQSKIFYTSFANANFFIGQTANFQHPSETFRQTGFEDRWSDYLGRTSVKIGSYMDMQYRFRLDRSSGNLRRNELLMSVGDRFLKANFDYLILPRFRGEEEGIGGRQLHIGLASEYIDNWTFFGGMTRELGSNSMALEHRVGAIYENECFKFESSVAKSFYKDRDIQPGHTLLFRLVFKTLGQIRHKKELSPTYRTQPVQAIG